MSSAFHPATALDNTLGAVFIGVTLAGMYVFFKHHTFKANIVTFLSTSLYGITCVQSYTYFKNNRDNQWFKRVVCAISAAHSAPKLN